MKIHTFMGKDCQDLHFLGKNLQNMHFFEVKSIKVDTFGDVK